MNKRKIILRFVCPHNLDNNEMIKEIKLLPQKQSDNINRHKKVRRKSKL